jgi:hypothetical protein
MAKLKDYRAPRKDVRLSDGETYSVRGLSLSDLMEGFNAHREQMQTVFEGFRSGDLTDDQMGEAIIQAVRAGPEVIALLTARACDEPDEADTVKVMPLDDQVILAAAILDLTLRDGLVLKKVIEIAQTWSGRIAPRLTKN